MAKAEAPRYVTKESIPETRLWGKTCFADGIDKTYFVVVAEFLEDCRNPADADRRPLAAKTIQNYDIRLSRLADAFEKRPTASVSADEIKTWLRGLRQADGAKYAPNTMMNFRADGHTFFNYAIDEGYCKSNPKASETSLPSDTCT